jgi:hypothetical protein
MSADNWRVCPVCLRNTVQARKKAITDARAQYGKIPAEEFMAKLAAAEKLPERPEESLAEYYETGISEDGEFFIHYSGGCRECGFQYQFDEKHDALDDWLQTGEPIDRSFG